MKILKIIGWTEIAIGVITFCATFLSIISGANTKTPNVFFFVIATALISTVLGIGILRLRRGAYLLLLYFASVIFLSKTLIFLDIIHLNGALETTIPADWKNWISMIYHAGVGSFLASKHTRKIFYPG